MQNKGFTLVETLIYIAIISGVLAAFVSFALNISEARTKTYVAEEVQANARVALETIVQKIRSAAGLNIGTSVFNTDPGVLSLMMNNSSLNPTVINLSSTDGSLQIKEGSDSPVAVTSNRVKITNLVFRNFTSVGARANVGIELTVAYVKIGRAS